MTEPVAYDPAYWGRVPAYWRQKGLPVRAANALANAGIRNLDDLKKVTCADLLQLSNFGRVSLHEVQMLTGLPKDRPATRFSHIPDQSLIAEIEARGYTVTKRQSAA